MENEKWKMIFCLTQVHQTSLQCRRCRLGSISHSELAENVIDVTLNSGFADLQTGAYFFIALASYDQLEHFHLSTGQIGASHSLGKPLGDNGRDVPRAGVHC